ncbi:MAG: hypothetical protein IJ838_06790 [Paludibacteraceae bacterium]|nr:hypothetical protein [Paludibacteraceae bacterium]
MAKGSRIAQMVETKREDGYTDIMVVTAQGNVAHGTYFLDCDRDYNIEKVTKEAFDKDED